MITVIDAPCGAGKTSWAIGKMNMAQDDERFIFITPFLKEIDRIKQSVMNRKFYDPTNSNNKGTKLEGLKKLIKQGKNICSTHALFKQCDKELLWLLEYSGFKYTLILDECMNVLEEIKITEDDFNIFKEQKLIQIQPDNKVVWLDKDYKGAYEDYKRFAETDCLYSYSDKLFIWTFPYKIFKAFDNSYILTYLFDGQIQKAYYDMFGLEYQKRRVKHTSLGFRLGDYIPYWEEDHDNLRKLIHICEDERLNKIDISSSRKDRKKQSDFSKSWYEKNIDSTQMSQLFNNAHNFLWNKNKAKSDEVIWTTFKLKESKDGTPIPYKKVKGYSKRYIPCNSRATNDYCNTSNLVYLVNRYLSPVTKQFFLRRGVEIQEELWALSELIQWIWRSRIRRGESINIYIPSARMRSLLEDYLVGKELE